MNETNAIQNEIPEKGLTDGKLFAEAILNAKGELYKTLYLHFSEEMNKALKGRICTPERMAKLYPMFREINIETEEINAFADAEDRRFQRQERKQLNRKGIYEVIQ